MRREVDVCIVGGGPAGLLLALLLVRRGVRCIVLEQHGDFHREYRGEILMPRFTHLMRRLGLLDHVLQFPHTKLDSLEMLSCAQRIARVPLSAIDPLMPYAIWMSQPVLLTALMRKAAEFPGFEIVFGACCQRLIQEDGKTVGLIARTTAGDQEIRARVTIGADGRWSSVRRLGGFTFAYEHHDFDVYWFSLPRPADWGTTFRLYYTPSRSFVISPRHPELLQCGLLTMPGEFSADRSERLNPLRLALRSGPAFLHPFADSLEDPGQFVRLRAGVALVQRWAGDGIALLGDAAHTCSPVGAVGVSVAAATAAVGADVIVAALAAGNVSAASLDRVQELRQHEIRRIHRIQRLFAGSLLSPSPLVRWLLPRAMPWMSRTGVPQWLHRQLVNEVRPLTLHQESWYRAA